MQSSEISNAKRPCRQEGFSIGAKSPRIWNRTVVTLWLDIGRAVAGY
jgi:hypothetical protein